MNKQKLKNYIFSNISEDKAKIIGGLLLSFIISIAIYLFQPKNSTLSVPPELEVNLSVMIPKGHLIYPFEASNFDNVEPLLGAYNMVQVYDPQKGTLIAKNIKVLRAPKDPSQLAFIIPVEIANKLAPFGLEFKIALQKEVNKPPIWVLNKNSLKKSKHLITFGG